MTDTKRYLFRRMVRAGLNGATMNAVIELLKNMNTRTAAIIVAGIISVLIVIGIFCPDAIRMIIEAIIK